MKFNPAVYERLLQLPSPFYLYDLSLLQQTLKSVKQEADAFNYKVHYALKANNNDRILREIKATGLGIDCVSGAEVEKAIEAGFSANEIILAGAGKNDHEIEIALGNNIACINCESIQELIVIAEIAKAQNKIASIALRINPGIDARTHSYITTGIEATKFGIHEKDVDNALNLIKENAFLKLTGLHIHIGSQITDKEVFKKLCLKINDLNNYFSQSGIFLEHINAGGGLGINYTDPDIELIPDFASYFSIFNRHLQLQNKQDLQVELGRSIVAQCGSLVSRVLYNKSSGETEFLILDAGMTELLRPALYQAYHHIEKPDSNPYDPKRYYDIVGPICESSDYLGRKILLPESKRGDLLIIRSVGAYGEVMSSNYNLRKKAQAFYFDGEEVTG